MKKISLTTLCYIEEDGKYLMMRRVRGRTPSEDLYKGLPYQPIGSE